MISSLLLHRTWLFTVDLQGITKESVIVKERSRTTHR